MLQRILRRPLATADDITRIRINGNPCDETESCSFIPYLVGLFFKFKVFNHCFHNILYAEIPYKSSIVSDIFQYLTIAGIKLAPSVLLTNPDNYFDSASGRL